MAGFKGLGQGMYKLRGLSLHALGELAARMIWVTLCDNGYVGTMWSDDL